MTKFAKHPATSPWIKPAKNKPTPQSVRDDKDMRENLTEKQIDKTLEDSFPASDPPAWY